MNGFRLLLLRLKQYILNNKLIFSLFLLGSVLNTLVVSYCYGNMIPLVTNRHSPAYLYRYYEVQLGPYASLESVLELEKDPLVSAFAFAQTKTPYGSVGEFPQELERYVIPKEDYLQEHGDSRIKRLMVMAKDRQDPENDQVLAMLWERFPKSESITGTVGSLVQSDTAASSSPFILIVCNAFLAVIANTFLLHWLLNTRRRENSISSILGASRLTLTALLFGEAILLSAASIVLGILLHVLLYLPLFQPMNLYSYIRYSPGDYGVIALILFSLSCVAVIPVVLREAFASPDAAKRKAL